MGAQAEAVTVHGTTGTGLTTYLLRDDVLTAHRPTEKTDRNDEPMVTPEKHTGCKEQLPSLIWILNTPPLTR